MSSSRSQGISLIEVVVFLVVVGIGVAGVVMLFGQLTRASPDPLVRKQALSVAQSVMDEILLRGFTYCDPDDPAVGTAASSGACATAEAIGPEPGETRYADPAFDNVNDYNGFAMAGANLRDITNTSIAGLESYSVSVSVAAISPGELPAIADVNDALRVVVTVVGPLGVEVALRAYRTRYAPNQP